MAQVMLASSFVRSGSIEFADNAITKTIILSGPRLRRWGLPSLPAGRIVLAVIKQEGIVYSRWKGECVRFVQEAR